MPVAGTFFLSVYGMSMGKMPHRVPKLGFPSHLCFPGHCICFLSTCHLFNTLVIATWKIEEKAVSFPPTIFKTIFTLQH